MRECIYIVASSNRRLSGRRHGVGRRLRIFEDTLPPLRGFDFVLVLWLSAFVKQHMAGIYIVGSARLGSMLDLFSSSSGDDFSTGRLAASSLVTRSGKSGTVPLNVD